jgi:hypothetical protein
VANHISSLTSSANPEPCSVVASGTDRAVRSSALSSASLVVASTAAIEKPVMGFTGLAGAALWSLLLVWDL